ncbi:MAG: glycosyltransferase [Burkholderiales bacterium]|nr:glycosyltransferase [Burkholderiales bacterium]
MTAAREHGGQRVTRGESPVKVSIVTVVYDGVATLADALRSVREQQCSASFEHIVVDGGSSDGTVELLREQGDSIAYWCSERDRGIYDAMNKGIALARGEIIGILNADDTYECEAIQRAVQALEADPGAGYCYGWLRLVDACGRPLGVVQPVSRDRFASRVTRETPLPHPTMFVRRSVYEQYGVFDSLLRLAGDFELILRLHLQGVRGIEIPAVMANFLIGGASTNPLILTEQRQTALKYGAPAWRAWSDWAVARSSMAVKRWLPASAIGWLRHFKQRVFLRAR